MIDLWTSRRDKFLKCKFWSQDEAEENGVDDAEIAYKLSPSGSFYAKEMNSYNFSNQILADVFMAESITITIFTEDDVNALKRNDIIEFDGEVYRVEEIQKTPYKKQRQFLKQGYSNGYFIALRG